MLNKTIDEIVAAYPWPPLTHADNFTQLLGFIAADDAIQDQRWVAYLLATIRHETAFTFAPIEEYGKGSGKPYGETDPVTGVAYYGRGFVQLTWTSNYQKFGTLLGVNLVALPQLALDPTVSYRIASLGMREGLFTGVGFSRFLNDTETDFVGARKIINGLDQAEKIAGYATEFLATL